MYQLGHPRNHLLWLYQRNNIGWEHSKKYKAAFEKQSLKLTLCSSDFVHKISRLFLRFFDRMNICLCYKNESIRGCSDRYTGENRMTVLQAAALSCPSSGGTFQGRPHSSGCASLRPTLCNRHSEPSRESVERFWWARVVNPCTSTLIITSTRPHHLPFLPATRSEAGLRCPSPSLRSLHPRWFSPLYIHYTVAREHNGMSFEKQIRCQKTSAFVTPEHFSLAPQNVQV